jgi:hypothetical protein
MNDKNTLTKVRKKTPQTTVAHTGITHLRLEELRKYYGKTNPELYREGIDLLYDEMLNSKKENHKIEPQLKELNKLMTDTQKLYSE